MDGCECVGVIVWVKEGVYGCGCVCESGSVWVWQP